MKILLPVDGSEPSNRAVDYAIKQAGLFKDGVDIHLLNVQSNVRGVVASFVSSAQIKQYHHDEGMAALKSATQRLDAAGVKYQCHIGLGDAGETIVGYAKEKDCDQIVMATRGMGGVSGMLLGSVATKVIYLSPIPVLLVK